MVTHRRQQIRSTYPDGSSGRERLTVEEGGGGARCHSSHCCYTYQTLYHIWLAVVVVLPGTPSLKRDDDHLGQGINTRTQRSTLHQQRSNHWVNAPDLARMATKVIWTATLADGGLIANHPVGRSGQMVWPASTIIIEISSNHFNLFRGSINNRNKDAHIPCQPLPCLS